MTSSTNDTTPWRTATATGDGQNCVEVRRHDGMIEVRDTKDRTLAAHRYTSGEWAAFLDGARKGEFDDLI